MKMQRKTNVSLDVAQHFLINITMRVLNKSLRSLSSDSYSKHTCKLYKRERERVQTRSLFSLTIHENKQP